MRAWSSEIQRARISGVAWDALMRTTFTPASRSAVIWEGSAQDGPSVATILVRLTEAGIRGF